MRGEESDVARWLDTWTVERECEGLMERVWEEGGYGFVRNALAGDKGGAEAARDMAWEQLHCGPWHAVAPVWRDAYALACLLEARWHCTAGAFKEGLRCLDMGLIMGGMLLRHHLHNAAHNLSLMLSNTNTNTHTPTTHPLVSLQFSNDSQALQSLPFKSFSSKTVTKESALSLERFLKDYYLSRSPVIITDCMDHWPAKTKWNDIDYLKRIAGDRTVPVEVGKNYLCAEWKQELITFSDFLQRIESPGCPSWGPTYLAQHPLFDQIPELRKDICIPDYCFTGGGELRSVNAWFGPAGTVTPLHHDPHHNILAQVVGKKYIRLYSASYTEELYPHTETMLCNSSQVDLDDMDEEKFPKAVELEFVDCILEEGDMLYIPPRWWHYVRSLTASLSVSFWWSEGESSCAS